MIFSKQILAKVISKYLFAEIKLGFFTFVLNNNCYVSPQLQNEKLYQA